MITKLTRHNHCEVEAILGPFGNHYAKLICKKHKAHIQWISEADYTKITGLRDDPSVSQYNNAK